MRTNRLEFAVVTVEFSPSTVTVDGSPETLKIFEYGSWLDPSRLDGGTASIRLRSRSRFSASFGLSVFFGSWVGAFTGVYAFRNSPFSMILRKYTGGLTIAGS